MPTASGPARLPLARAAVRHPAARGSRALFTGRSRVMGAVTVGRGAAPWFGHPHSRTKAVSLFFLATPASRPSDAEVVSAAGILGTRDGTMTDGDERAAAAADDCDSVLVNVFFRVEPAPLVQVQFAAAPTWKSAVKKRKRTTTRTSVRRLPGLHQPLHRRAPRRMTAADNPDRAELAQRGHRDPVE